MKRHTCHTHIQPFTTIHTVKRNLLKKKITERRNTRKPTNDLSVARSFNHFQQSKIIILLLRLDAVVITFLLFLYCLLCAMYIDIKTTYLNSSRPTVHWSQRRQCYHT